MGLSHLLPPGARRRLRRLRQDAADVVTALTTPRRPIAREGALTAPAIYTAPDPPQPGCGSPASADAGSDSAARVLFVDYDAEVSVAPGQTILQAGLEAGLDLDFSCTVGGCAACALQLVDGEVVYDAPNCLNEAERRRGMCLACVGRPRGKIVVESL